MKTLWLLIHIALLFLVFGLIMLHWSVWVYANNITAETVYQTKYNEDTMELELYPPNQRWQLRRME